MAAIITTKYKVRTAKDFLENFDRHPIQPPETSAQHETDRNHYVFVGRSKAWPTDLVAGIDDLTPPTPLDTEAEARRIWDDIIGMTVVHRAYTSLAIKRWNWHDDPEQKTIYAKYDDNDADLFNHPTDAEILAADTAGNTYIPGPFYTITDEFHVFKCLDNGGGAKSTEKPTLPLGSTDWIVNTADGYKWKYMFTVLPSDAIRFVTDRWIPVKTLASDDGSNQWQVQQASTDGSIDTAIVEEEGSEYIYAQENKEVQSGATTNTMILQDGSSDVDAYVGSTVWIEGEDPKLITAYDEVTKQITIDGNWSVSPPEHNPPTTISLYSIWPTLTISGNGTGAEGYAKVDTSTDKVSEIVMTSYGSNYHYATAAIAGGKTVAGIQATARPVLSPLGGHGKDAEYELGAHYTIVNSRLKFNEPGSDFPISNDYRQIGLIRDVKDPSGTLLNLETGTALKTLSLTGITIPVDEFQPDEEIYVESDPTVKAKIIQFIPDTLDPTLGTILYTQDETTDWKDFNIGDKIIGVTTTTYGYVDSITDEEVGKHTGEILYIENRRPILRAPEQTEDIKIIIEF